MRFPRVLIPGLLLSLLVGCSHEAPPLRVGLLVWPPYELAVLAREKDWLGDRPIRLVEYRSPAELSRAFRNDLLDAIFLTSHISLRLADTGVDHRIVYVIDFSRGGDALVAKEGRGLDSLEDLRGERIAVEPSALGAYVFQRAMDFGGLSREDVKVVPLDVAKQVPYWNRGGVAAVVCYEPVRTRLVRRGGQVLFDSRRIPREIADVVMARTSVIRDRPGDLQALLRGMSRALAHYREHPKDARTIMARRESLSAEAFKLAINGAHLVGPEENRRLLRGESPELTEALKVQRRVMQRGGLLEGAPDPGKLITGRFVCEECLR